MNTETVLTDIDGRIAERHLLLHPFYQAWTKGELTAAALKDYAIQYYRHVAAFPTYLSAVHSHTEDAATRRQVLANLVDEEAGSPNHPELWLAFAARMGAARSEVEGAQPWEETRGLVDAFRAICGGRSTAEGLAALYTYESQIPAVAASKIDGLEKFYGVSDEGGLAYFKVHEEADKEHSAVERRLLARHVTEENTPAVRRAVDETLAALWEMLSGVCRRHGIGC
ncbi:MAG TPA: CADD family putative folate metabolism protein [Bryobacteraceae bacterium]|nr:CADD family putative folate metabolism protein [Bryobacteraceae bacterium]